MIYLFVYVLFIILICVLIYNTMSPTLLYNYIFFSLNRAALKKQYFTELCLPCINIF